MLILISPCGSAATRYDTPIARAVVARIDSLDVESTTPAREARARRYLEREYGVKRGASQSEWAGLHPDQREELAVREAIDRDVQTLIEALWFRGKPRSALSEHARAELTRAVDLVLTGVRDWFEARRLRLAWTGTFGWAASFRDVHSRAYALDYVSTLADALVRTLNKNEHRSGRPSSSVPDPGAREALTTALRVITEVYLVSAFVEPERGPVARARSWYARVRHHYDPSVVELFWDQVRAQQLDHSGSVTTTDFEIYDGVDEISAAVMDQLRTWVSAPEFVATCEDLFR